MVICWNLHVDLKKIEILNCAKKDQSISTEMAHIQATGRIQKFIRKRRH